MHEAQKLLGKLTHTAQIFLEGHPQLANLEAMLTIFGQKPFVPHTPPKGMQDDINWWSDCLATKAPPSPIPTPRPPIDLYAYSDASSSIGIGIYVHTRAVAGVVPTTWLEH